MDSRAVLNSSRVSDPVQDAAVRDLAAQPQGARASCRREDLGRGGGRPAELHVVQVHVAAVGGHLLTAQQRAQRLDVLAQQRDRRLGARAHLAHPVLHAVADADRQAAGKQPVQRGGLHRGERHVPERNGEHADSTRSRVVQASAAAAVATPPPQKQSSQSHSSSSPSSSAARATSRSRSGGTWGMHVAPKVVTRPKGMARGSFSP